MWYNCEFCYGESVGTSSDRNSVTEQPLKIPYVAAIILYANEQKADIAKVIIERTGLRLQAALEASEWRSFKLLLRFLVSMHGLFEADGAMPLLDELFNKAADLQTESNDDVSSNGIYGGDSSLTIYRHLAWS